MMNEVVAYGSCCECGTCVLVCPHNVIDYVDGKPKQVAKATAPFDYCGISEGIGCDVCAQVCPRLGLREFDLRDPVLAMEPGVYEGLFGRYRRVVAARCKDPDILARCQDGGVVTAILCHGLREGLFDGAVVSAADETMPAAPKPKVVTTVAEAIASASSWYTYCPNNLALADAELVEMNLHRAQEYARPECHHCGDFTAELADISCGGVAAMDWTITILRSQRGEELFDDMVKRGLLAVRPMEEFENSMKVMLRLTKKQRDRVPVPPGRTPRYVRPEGYPRVPADPPAP